MAGYYADAERYPISSWFLGCLEKEIGYHVQAEQERIIALLTAKYSELANASHFADSNYYLEAIALIKGEK